MKKVSMYQLKQELASVIAEAEGGGEVVITRHNRPVARLVPAEIQHLHIGPEFGEADLHPAIHEATRGRYLELVLEDRKEGERKLRDKS